MNNMGWFRRLAGVCIARPVNAVGGTRNQVTTLRLIVGVSAAAFLAAGSAWFYIAAGLLVFGFLLAHADAELTRLSGEVRPVSGRYAFFTNVFSYALAFLGLGAGLQASTTPALAGVNGLPAPIILGLIAAIVVVVLPLLVKRLEVIDGRRSPELDGLAGFDSDDLVLLLPLAIGVGWAEGLLVIAAFGGAAFAGGLYMAHFRKYHSLV